MLLFRELKRRNVLRVGAAYAVASWLLVQIAETIFPLFGFSETPARVVVVTLAIGFIPTLIFAWVFELTPDGLKKEKDVDRSTSITPRTGKKLDQMIMLMLAIAVTYFAFDKFVLGEIREATIEEKARQSGRTEALMQAYGDRSIAVLPFVDLSADRDQEYMSDGIAEELLNSLTRIPELRVTSRSSAFSFKGTSVRLSEVAEALNVAHVLEGSVRKAGDEVRITVKLVDARSDTQLWSRTYKQTLNDIFSIQDEIAAKVTEELKVTLLDGKVSSDRSEPEAYILFLQARHIASQYTAASMKRAEVLYKQALDRDPNFSDAWAGLARNYANLVNWGFIPNSEGALAARKAAESAAASNPDSADAHLSLAIIAMEFDSDLATAAQQIEKALELDPANTMIVNGAAKLLRYLGRSEEAVIVQHFVVSRDPVNPAAHFNLGLYYLDAGQPDESIRSFHKSLQLSPQMAGPTFYLGTAQLCRGEPQAALDTYSLVPDESLKDKGIVLALFALGRQNEHAEKLAEYVGAWGDKWPADVASLYAFAGDFDAAYIWLDRAVEQGVGIAEEIKTCFYSKMRGDERWNEILSKIGQAPEQLGAIDFSVRLPGRSRLVNPK